MAVSRSFRSSLRFPFYRPRPAASSPSRPDASYIGLADTSIPTFTSQRPRLSNHCFAFTSKIRTRKYDDGSARVGQRSREGMVVSHSSSFLIPTFAFVEYLECRSRTNLLLFAQRRFVRSRIKRSRNRLVSITRVHDISESIGILRRWSERTRRRCFR